MWSAQRTELDPGWSERIVIRSARRPLTFGEVIEGWRSNEAFRDYFMGELAAAQFPAFFWEMPPIRGRRVDFDYEYVVIRNDALARMPADPGAFESKLRKAPFSHPVATFFNLGRDALLIAPKPVARNESYGHLAAFLRLGPESQRHALFRDLGRALSHILRICDGRLWTSTSGLGVPWLHLRLDTVPKYYNHLPYRNG